MKWKLNLRYGKTSTPYKHYTVVADGEVLEVLEGFEHSPGKAWMGMKVWATDQDEAANMVKVIGREVGFKVTGRILIYDTDPKQPPGDKPHGYDINFSSYE